MSFASRPAEVVYLPEASLRNSPDGEVRHRAHSRAGHRRPCLSIDDLRREIERRQKAAGRLQARRDELATELAEIEAQLKAMGALHNTTTTIQPVARARQASGSAEVACAKERGLVGRRPRDGRRAAGRRQPRRGRGSGHCERLASRRRPGWNDCGEDAREGSVARASGADGMSG